MKVPLPQNWCLINVKMTIKASRLQQSLFRLFVFFFQLFCLRSTIFCRLLALPRDCLEPREYIIRASERVPFSTSSQFESCQMYQVLNRQTEKVLFAVYALTMPDSSYVAITLIGLLFTHENGVQIGFCATLWRSVNRCFAIPDRSSCRHKNLFGPVLFRLNFS